MGKPIKTNNYIDFYYHFFRNILLVGIPLVIISALALSLPHSSAESNASGDATRVDSVTLNLAVSCTISATELTPHIATFEGSGLHRENIGTTKVGVFCNDNNGYNIYAVGHSNNIDGNTDLVVSGLSSDYNIKTGIYSSGSTVSSWGMKITPGTGTGSESERTPPTANNGYDNYNVVPSTYTMVASRASGTNMNPNVDLDVTGSYFTTTYDIYASSAQPAGTYTGKVKYILTHPNTNAPSTINDIDAAFAINGKQKVYQDSKGSYYAMQDMTTDICNSVTRTGEATTTQLVDIRDHKLYYVTKLKDGHCWMTQNLDLDLSHNKPLSSDNTDLNDNIGTAYQDGYTSNNGILYWTPKNTTKQFSGASAGGDNKWEYVEHSYNKTDDTNAGHQSIGNYYTWTAAIASNDSSSLTSSTLDNISGNPQNSICPKGWRLPTASSQANDESGSTNEYGRLNYLYNSNFTSSDTELTQSPLYFVKSGFIHYNLMNYGVDGYYQTSTVYSNTNSYIIRFKNDNVSPLAIADYNGWGGRTNGFPLRCLAR